MRWLLWAKVHGEWVYFGDFRMNAESDLAIRAVYETTDDQHINLYVPSLGNWERQ